MKIINIEQYFDGGTIEIYTDDNRIFSIDDRLFTKTPNRLYNGYPKDDNSNLIGNPQEIERELLEALKDYKDEWHFEKIVIDIIKKNLE